MSGVVTPALAHPTAASRWLTRARKLVAAAIVTATGLAIFAVLAFPNLWLFLTSLKDDQAAWAIPPQYIPLHPTLEKYVVLFSGAAAASQTRELEHWYLYVLNSAYVSVVPAILSTAIGTLAGYGFARFRFPGASLLLMLLLVGQMFPGPSLFIPIYLLVDALGLHDSLNALIIIYTAFHIPVATWLASGFFRTIPIELEEAARIDGCNLLQTMLYVAIPLAKIGVVTIAILGFMAFWGEYGFASILLETQDHYTATISMVRAVSEIAVSFNSVGAAGTVMGVPLLIFLMLMQRQFVRGMTAGALKES
ncbi:MAG TPA: carbohydrate ABC transporter permease [Chloroflexota bacterium]|nr:carbohydrate ABC transporter permease [Chloroflexota bacterium]